MKVLMINGSPHEHGCTYTALSEIAKVLTAEGVESEIFWVGSGPVQGCTACGGCGESGLCVMADAANEVILKMRECGGLIVGSPTHYASPSGAVISLLDRVFFAAQDEMAQKPASAIVSARRGGTSAALEVLWKYFTIAEMPVVSSTYWSMVHGFTPEDVRRDEEGLQTMRNIGHNMAWLLKSIEAGKKAGLPAPATEHGARTNFIK